MFWFLWFVVPLFILISPRVPNQIPKAWGRKSNCTNGQVCCCNLCFCRRHCCWGLFLTKCCQWVICVWTHKCQEAPRCGSVVMLAGMISISETPQLAILRTISYETCHLMGECWLNVTHQSVQCFVTIGTPFSDTTSQSLSSPYIPWDSKKLIFEKPVWEAASWLKKWLPKLASRISRSCFLKPKKWLLEACKKLVFFCFQNWLLELASWNYEHIFLMFLMFESCILFPAQPADWHFGLGWKRFFKLKKLFQAKLHS